MKTKNYKCKILTNMLGITINDKPIGTEIFTLNFLKINFFKRFIIKLE